MRRPVVLGALGKLGVSAALLAGCHHHRAHRPTGDFFPIPPPTDELVQSGQSGPVIPAGSTFAALESYKLRAGDRVGFTIQVEPDAGTEAYTVAGGDQLNIDYLHVPVEEQKRLTMPVKPDGTIDLPMIGQLYASGKTVEQLEEEANDLAWRYWRHPQIVVTMASPLARAEALRRAFASEGTLNPTMTLPVEPDGNLELPMIGQVRAFGRTMIELRDDVLARYRETIPGVRVTPFLAQRAPDRVYVLGEVGDPGMLLLDRPTSVIQAIGQAGSWRRSAELREVVLIRGYTDGTPRATLLDLDKAIELEKKRDAITLADDLWVRDGDIIVVPKDPIENVNQFVERVLTRGVYGLIPGQAFFNVSQ